MGWFDGSSILSGSPSRKPTSKRNHSTGSIYGQGLDDRAASKNRNSSRTSFLNFASGASHTGRSSSYYKRSPRKGYINKVYSQLRRLLRDLLYYLKKNPLKVFMLVVMPLITGGLLTGLLAKFGIRLPIGVERMLAKLGGNAGAFSEGFGRGGRLSYERTSRTYEGSGSGFGGIANIVGGLGGLGTAVSVAKMFM